jgi:hypothetical protein
LIADPASPRCIDAKQQGRDPHENDHQPLTELRAGQSP